MDSSAGSDLLWLLSARIRSIPRNHFRCHCNHYLLRFSRHLLRPVINVSQINSYHCGNTDKELPTSFHTFMNHSQGVWHACSQLDHLGIVLVIWGSSIASTHFGFHSSRSTCNVYWAFSTIAALLASWATFQPIFRTPTGRRIRVLLYCALGLSAFIPAIHGVLMHGWEEQNQRQSLSYFAGLGALNGLGTAIYGARIPERWFPRRFDVYGASHQIMHVLVMCGAYSHAIGLNKAAEYWSEQRLSKA